MDDVKTVIDAAGAEQVALVAHAAGGAMAMLFAATYPERVSGLVLLSSFATMRRHDDYPIGIPPSVADSVFEWLSEGWGTGDTLDVMGPAAPPTLSCASGSGDTSASPPARAPRPR